MAKLKLPRFKKKTWIILIVIFIVIVLMIIANKSQANKAKAQAESEAQSITSSDGTNSEGLSDSELEQKAFIEQWGNPPEGFRWNDDGELVATGDSDLSAEDVSYSFLRALSTLDMSTAQKYSNNSVVVNSYNKYYSPDADQSYYNQFLRKMYKEVLLSVEVDGVQDTAVFANGQRILTFNVKALDLTNKDFWLPDKEKIFNTLYTYSATESDNTKANQYLYDYILSYYQSDKAVKRDIQIDLVVDKVTLGGWLVNNDNDLDMLCAYTDGDIVVNYIQDCYADWVDSMK